MEQLELINADLLTDSRYVPEWEGEDMSFTNGEGTPDVPTQQTTQKKGISAEDIQSLAETGTMLAGLWAARPKDAQKQAVKQACGSKPLFGATAKARWYDCQRNFLRGQSTLPTGYVPPTLPREEEDKKRVHPAVWITVGIVAAGLVTFAIVKLAKRK